MSDEPKPRDRILLHSPVESGEGVHVLRLRGDRVEVGEVRPVRDGQPLHGELVKLSPVPEQPRAFDVEVLADARVKATATLREGGKASVDTTASTQEPLAARAPSHADGLRKGPPKVVSDAYREGWEAIFGRRGGEPDRSLN